MAGRPFLFVVLLGGVGTKNKCHTQPVYRQQPSYASTLTFSFLSVTSSGPSTYTLPETDWSPNYATYRTTMEVDSEVTFSETPMPRTT